LQVPDFTKYLPHEETTLAEAFRANGYSTASIGKWHLGGPEYYPDRQGFDVNLAGTDRPSPKSYFAPWNIPTLSEGEEGEYLTDRLGDEAVRWIEREKDHPFFLYLSHFAVHTPIQGGGDLVAKYRQIKRAGLVHSNAVYAAMIDSLDATVGRIRDKLSALGLAERTLLVFTSDNGGRVPTTSNHPLRVGKGSCYEGGTRVPLIVHWPGVTRPNTTQVTPVITMDLYPTLLEAAGLPRSNTRNIDGVSLVPLLRESGDLAARDLFWHYPHYQHYQLGGTTPYGAIRSGDFKLIEFFDDMRVELYDLKGDPGEQHTMAEEMPEVANDLRARLHAWQRASQVQMPSPNPDYDPTRPEHTPVPRGRR
jgi:arylsulfatase A-like enzyme